MQCFRRVRGCRFSRTGAGFRRCAIPSPEDVVFTQMLTGWRNQQLSRNLSFGTIEGRERLVTRFQESTNEYPWQWTPAHVDEFFGDLRSVKHAAHSRIRSYQAALRAFCSYVASPDYGSDRVCEQYFGTHPSQVCFDWNTTTGGGLQNSWQPGECTTAPTSARC
jgi:hypothetical protein